jgi:hypothetical protein
MIRWAILTAAAIFAVAVAYAGGDDAIRLSLNSPNSQILITAGEARSSSVIRVRVAAIENPDLTPFGVVVSVLGGGEIGRFAVYPADQTGDYALSLTPTEATALSKPDATVSLALDLIHPATDRLVVTIGSVRLD